MATLLYALALLLLPFSSALKEMLELTGAIWIAPALVLAPIIFVLLRPPIRDKQALALACFAIFGGFIGSFYLAPSVYREHSAFYAFYAEPGRLCLNIIWYWVSLEFLILKRDFVLRWLAVSATCQLALGIYMYLAMLEITPVPEVIAIYLKMYKSRQAVSLDPAIYRMSGTFFEGPPFGLFMFSCLVIFVLSWVAARKRLTPVMRRWLIWGGLVSLVGAVASLSNGVLVAIAIFALSSYLLARGKLLVEHRSGKIVEAFCGLLLLIGVVAYTGHQLVTKWEEAAGPAPMEYDVIGLSAAERMFHIRYGLSRLAEVPLAVLTGIGPGRYGDYAVRTGQFPPTVDIAVTPVEWLVEYGLVGTGVILGWVWNIGKRCQPVYGKLALGALLSLLVADSAQATWLWETWFLALAFLFTSTEYEAIKNSELKLS